MKRELCLLIWSAGVCVYVRACTRIPARSKSQAILWDLTLEIEAILGLTVSAIIAVKLVHFVVLIINECVLSQVRVCFVVF